MADLDTPGADPVTGTPPPPATDPTPPPPAGAQSAPSPGDDDDFDKERALKTIRNLREQEKAYKAQLKELDAIRAERAAAEAAKLSDAERAQAALKAAEEKVAQAERQAQETAARLRAELVRNRVLTAAPGLGIDPALAAELVTPAALEFGDDGEPTNLKAVLKMKKEQFPALATRPASSTSPTNPARGEPAPESDAARRSRIYGGAASPFDPAVARQYGGGVFFNTNPTKRE